MTDKDSAMFLKIAEFKRRARGAPDRRMFNHLKRHPHIPIGLAHNTMYRQAWPHDPKSMHNEAVLLLSQGHAEQARALLLTAISIRPDLGNAWADLAVAHTHLKNPQAALVCAEKAIARLPPESPIPYNIKGIALAQLQRVPEAIRALKHSLFLDEEQSKTHRNLGAIFQSRADAVTACKHYKRALQLDPWFDPAYKKYCTVLIASGRREEAMRVMAGRSEFFRRDTRVKPVDAADRNCAPSYKLPPPGKTPEKALGAY
jgi:tetratricopeptide (TPR) repeat protein